MVPGAVCGLLGVGDMVISVLQVVLPVAGDVLLLVMPFVEDGVLHYVAYQEGAGLLLVVPFGCCVWLVPQVSPKPLVRLAVGSLVLRFGCGVVPVPYLAYANFPCQSLKVVLLLVPGTVFGLLGVVLWLLPSSPCLVIRCSSRASLSNVSSRSFLFGGLPGALPVAVGIVLGPSFPSGTLSGGSLLL